MLFICCISERAVAKYNLHIETKSAIFLAMCMTALPTNITRNHWLRALHLFYAGLFALVLPFICWGAQATPGHPHARAHFVFVDPPMLAMVERDVESDKAAPPTAHAMHTQEDSATPLSTPAEMPAGRSVPSALLITLLLLVGTLITVLPPKNDGPGFFTWFSGPDLLPFYARIPTPPPR